MKNYDKNIWYQKHFIFLGSNLIFFGVNKKKTTPKEKHWVVLGQVNVRGSEGMIVEEQPTTLQTPLQEPQPLSTQHTPAHRI